MRQLLIIRELQKETVMTWHGIEFYANVTVSEDQTSEIEVTD